jgi:hypothetical protein
MVAVYSILGTLPRQRTDDGSIAATDTEFNRILSENDLTVILKNSNGFSGLINDDSTSAD